MKKILLASTILVGSAGIAAADISFSGSANLGIGMGTGNGIWMPMASASLDVAMSGETDGGLMFGADFTISAGSYGSVASSTSSVSGAVTSVSSVYMTAGTSGSVGDVTVWISGDFGKVSLEADPGTDVTIGYSGTFGSFGIAAHYVSSTGGSNGDWDAKLSYSSGDWSVYYKHAEDVSFVVGGAAVDTIGGSYSMGDWSFDASYEVDHAPVARSGWNLGVDWASGAISAGVDFGQGRGGLSSWGISAGYDLGGGASVDFAWSDADTATSGNEQVTLGVSMGF